MPDDPHYCTRRFCRKCRTETIQRVWWEKNGGKVKDIKCTECEAREKKREAKKK